ncbi:primary-amine oxidase [Ceratobasidium sp. AG-Ba]|nr:primary-amine oxidase [Ceratobasidium sp. AG-Ba]
MHSLWSLVAALQVAKLAFGAGTCPSDGALSVTAPKTNIWAPLSLADTKKVEDWLYKQKPLNLTRIENATMRRVSDNTLWLIESIMPNKTDALDYLDKKGGTPTRFARAVLYSGGLSTPLVQEYMVGPLPISSATAYTPYSYVYQNSTGGIGGSGVFPFNARYMIRAEAEALDNPTTKFDIPTELIISFMKPLARITQDLIGGSYTGSDDDKITYSWQGPTSFDGNWRRFWIFFTGVGNGAQYLIPTGFFAKIVYNNQVFTSTGAFVEAYNSGNLQRGVKPDLKNQDWSTRKKMGKARALDDRAAPRSVLFEGSRIKADKKQQYVEWMGWSFYLGFNRDTGLTMWNIKFKGDRIIYELSLQDAIAQYGGNDPVQASTAYLDRHYGIGQDSRQLLSGYDCPYGALTLNGSFHLEGEYLTSPGAICIFEADLGFPTSRHGDTVNKWYGSTKGTALTVRTMATVYNYDYMFDYIFYLEGTVEVRMAASGYLQVSLLLHKRDGANNMSLRWKATYWDPSQDDYGTRIQKTTMGSIHTHVINYKVDLDIAGTSNSLQTNEVFVEEVTKPWFDEEDGPTRQLRINRTWTVYLIANKNQKNQWGYPKSYRFQPGLHAVHNPVRGARRLLSNARWGEWDLMVAKRKDTEPSSSTTWSQHLPTVPPVDFSKFFDPAESIDQEDLVIYANLGMHHVPRAEDTPNTLFTDSRSSFILSPFNYYDDEPSRDIRNAILLQADKDGSYSVAEPGETEATCAPQGSFSVHYTGQVSYNT